MKESVLVLWYTILITCIATFLCHNLDHFIFQLSRNSTRFFLNFYSVLDSIFVLLHFIHSRPYVTSIYINKLLLPIRFCFYVIVPFMFIVIFDIAKINKKKRDRESEGNFHYCVPQFQIKTVESQFRMWVQSSPDTRSQEQW